MTTGYYEDGTVTVANDSVNVTGIGTAWTTFIRVGDKFTRDGYSIPIVGPTTDGVRINSDTALVLKYVWPGGSLTSNTYCIEELPDLTRNLEAAERYWQLMNGHAYFEYDANGSLAERDLYDTQRRGFAYLQDDVNPMRIWVKGSDTSGDWAGPASFGTGPTGATGPAPNLIGGSTTTVDYTVPASSSVTGVNPNYVLNLSLPRGANGWSIEPELVADGNRQVIRVADWIGGQGTPPATGIGLYVGVGGLVVDIADGIDLKGVAGPQGLRGTTWRGAWNNIDDYDIGDLVTDPDGSDITVVWIAIDDNVNSKPRDNPSDWDFFPGSFASTLNDGIWGDIAVTFTNDGIWGA